MAEAQTIEPAAVGEIETVNTDERRNLLAEQLEKVEPVAVAEPKEEKTEQTAAERARDASGKFVAKDPAAVSPQKPEGKEVATASPPPASEEPWKKPPQSWKKDVHPHWEKIPPEVAQYVHEREQQTRASVEQIIPKARSYDYMLKAIQPFAENIRIATGGTSDQHVIQAVKGLMEADHILRTGAPEQKRAYVFRLAQVYGVNLGDVSDAPQVNPQVFTIEQKLAALEGRLESERQAQAEAENRSLLNDIQQFATKHEHFETLKPKMIGLLNAGLATGLDDAYTQALRLHDDLFQADLAAKQAQAEAERIKSKDAAAKSARSAAVSVRSGTPTGNTAPKAQDRRAMLAEQFSEQDARL